MKKLPLFLLLLLVATLALPSCLKNEVADEYKDWRKANDAWLVTQQNLTDANGRPFYTAVKAPWDESAVVYMHWFNDTAKTRNNLKPLYSSTVDVTYIGRNYQNEAFDSSFLRTTPADSVYRTRLNYGIIEGWAIALTQMHIGDSVRVITPYNVGYGTYKMSNILLPFSNLVFDIKLKGIPYYETRETK